jgi:hypothetical protein
MTIGSPLHPCSPQLFSATETGIEPIDDDPTHTAPGRPRRTEDPSELERMRQVLDRLHRAIDGR